MILMMMARMMIFVMTPPGRRGRRRRFFWQTQQQLLSSLSLSCNTILHFEKESKLSKNFPKRDKNGGSNFFSTRKHESNFVRTEEEFFFVRATTKKNMCGKADTQTGAKKSNKDILFFLFQESKKKDTTTTSTSNFPAPLELSSRIQRPPSWIRIRRWVTTTARPTTTAATAPPLGLQYV